MQKDTPGTSETEHSRDRSLHSCEHRGLLTVLFILLHASFTAWLIQAVLYIGLPLLVTAMGVFMYYNRDCYQLGVCYSKSLPSVDNFVGREEDIRNITGYLDFTTSDVQVVHIVGPPGFGSYEGR